CGRLRRRVQGGQAVPDRREGQPRHGRAPDRHLGGPSDRAGRGDVREGARHRLSLRFFSLAAIAEPETPKQGLLVYAVHSSVRGVLIVGTAGTGKSTAVRGLAELLPEIDVVSDCPFSCSPTDLCPVCSGREDVLPVARRRRRIVDLPLNATEDRVAGTVDIAQALREGERALEPGLLAEANRGILYVDEINL